MSEPAPEQVTPEQQPAAPEATPEQKPEEQPQPQPQIQYPGYIRNLATWVDSPLPDIMLFFDKDGKVIEPHKNNYYPPVGKTVYDRNGNPFKAIYPEPETVQQRAIQESTKFDQETFTPMTKKMDDWFQAHGL
ncbi:hypothetical protein TVAG_070130 [Trichomonas vaginalis G3]|uniref:Uncharacterized protein n=1 Tax=Trichomonas vaginalis (strain ATCC PRA-98 / G3) TaxID=412133 RepID=A2D7R7_TRIV3|nr:hypothetical protein TVAGG3_1044370 [Trichomonas vaginalis G3]EAY23350.1 hypothetical protein TVAG_070130 [Trichomonas vaginalis G3]KAI5493758.1 hypothetical protein TVAGG3_1044370 [Trichomonas vaginalis G3]|eukprot:XP_001584336.1 hypothetical protein [Trichomonas vaginalis G3]